MSADARAATPTGRGRRAGSGCVTRLGPAVVASPRLWVARSPRPPADQAPPLVLPRPAQMKADYHRYIAEFKTEDLRKNAAEQTLLAYKAAQVRPGGACGGRSARQQLGARVATGGWPGGRWSPWEGGYSHARHHTARRYGLAAAGVDGWHTVEGNGGHGGNARGGHVASTMQGLGDQSTSTGLE
jgi:hypothetical protein